MKTQSHEKTSSKPQPMNLAAILDAIEKRAEAARTTSSKPFDTFAINVAKTAADVPSLVKALRLAHREIASMYEGAATRRGLNEFENDIASLLALTSSGTGERSSSGIVETPEEQIKDTKLFKELQQSALATLHELAEAAKIRLRAAGWKDVDTYSDLNAIKRYILDAEAERAIAIPHSSPAAQQQEWSVLRLNSEPLIIGIEESGSGDVISSGLTSAQAEEIVESHNLCLPNKAGSGEAKE